MTTHKEAAAHYPIREVFPAEVDNRGRVKTGNMGVQFRRAKDRCAALGLVHVCKDDAAPPQDSGQAFDGIILPGTPENDAPQGTMRWLGSVTLYYRPRMATTRSAE